MEAWVGSVGDASQSQSRRGQGPGYLELLLMPVDACHRAGKNQSVICIVQSDLNQQAPSGA